MPPELLQISAALSDRFLEIVDAQNAFREVHGRFAQLAPTHSHVPEELTSPDNADARIPSEPVCWLDLGSLPDEMRSCLTIEIYEGPLGHGFVVIARALAEGKVWRMAVNVGPELWRSHNWKEELEEAN